MESLTHTLHATSTVTIQWSTRRQRLVVRIHRPLKTTSTLIDMQCFLADLSQSLPHIRSDQTWAAPLHSIIFKRHSYVRFMAGSQKNHTAARNHGIQRP